ncbi:MAG: alpha/beta fold hydrolase [Bacteroidetes bacterium]|nr:alpha/beta fold hydrolase [Bacteroidota bacterium]
MRLNYRKLGQGKPLFILHGLFGLSDNWATVGKMLAEHFEVYLIDLRNHGSSPHSDEWTYSVIANDVLELMNDLHIDKSTNQQILLGHSLGGKVAMQFASMYPEKLEKLIVVDMAPKDYPGNHPDSYRDGFIEKLLTLNLAEMKSRKEVEAELKKIINDNATIQLLLKNIHWTALPAPLRHHPQSLSEGEGRNSQILEWKFNLKVIAKNQDKIGETFSIKNKIDTPTLFIRGEKSNYILYSDITEIKKIFPNSEFKTIEDAGHWVHADKPEEFAKTIIQLANS